MVRRTVSLHEPICMLHLFLDVLIYHGPINLQIAHPYVPSPDPPEPLQF